MELYGEFSGTMTTSQQWGSTYGKDPWSTTITFPISFISEPIVSIVLSRNGSINVFALSIDRVNNNNFVIFPLSLGAKVTDVPYKVYYTAIGKWK